MWMHDMISPISWGMKSFKNRVSNIIRYSEWGQKTFPFVSKILPPLYPPL